MTKEGQSPEIGPSDMEAAKSEIRRLQRELARTLPRWAQLIEPVVADVKHILING